MFNITGWNGTDTIEYSGFFAPKFKNVSHVSIYGFSRSVPDGGSAAMLLGLALLGVASVRRMLR